MKRKLAVLLICGMTLSLVGCGDDITLDKRENELLAEYIAGEMLKFSYDNEWEYTKVRTALNTYESNGTPYYIANATTVTSASTTATTAASTTTATTAANNSSSTTNKVVNKSTTTSSAVNASPDVYTTLLQNLGASGVSISASGYLAESRYPTEEYAVCLTAKDGYKIVAVEFEIKNSSSSEITLNTASSGITMRLSIGGKNIVQTASMLNNDIISLKDVKVEAGGTYTAVACFQVPEDAATGEATVTIYKSGTSIGTISGLTAK